MGATHSGERWTGAERGSSRGDAVPALAREVLQQAGEPLDRETRASMESRFGHGFAEVRVHSGASAAESAQQVSAAAFTAGSHIVFGAGRYAPSTGPGQSLLAHELAHVVGQARHTGEPVIARQPLDKDANEITLVQGAPGLVLRQQADARRSRSDAAGDTELPNAAEQRKQAHSTAVMKRVGQLAESEVTEVDRAVAGARLMDKVERRDWLLQQRDRRQSRGMGITWYSGPQFQAAEYERLQGEINHGLRELGLADEAALFALIGRTLPKQVLAKAKEIALAMLAENEAVARREQVRYGLHVSNRDQAGLLEADRLLARMDRRGKITELKAAVEREAAPLQRRGMGIAIVTRPCYRALSDAELEQHRADELRGVLGMQYPILLSENYRPGMFANADPMVLHEVIEGPAGEVLQNIARVRETIKEDELKVWQIPNAVGMAKLALGIGKEPRLLAAVDARIRSFQRDEQFWDWVKVALAIGTTILAGILLTPAAGALVGAAWGVESLVGNIRKYRLERAAEGTSLDPAVADMSVNEPELLWIVLDIVGLGLDLAVVTKAVRVAARGVMRNPGPATLDRLEQAVAGAGVPQQARGRLRTTVGQRFGIAADEVVDIVPQTRRAAVSDPALLAEYERLANRRMQAIIADVLANQGSTPPRRRLDKLFSEFTALGNEVGPAPLTAAQRKRAEAILREARDLARTDFGSVRTAMWRRLRKDPQLKELTQRMAAAGDVQLGKRGGSVRIRTVADDGRIIFQALEPDHLVRLSDNPWRYNDPRNLILTDSAQNQQFLEALRQQGSIWATDDVERFVVGNGLVDQATIHLPGGGGT